MRTVYLTATYMWDYQICMMEKKNHILEYNGKKIVYKTRDSYNDLFWNGIINWVNGKSSDNLLFGVRTLNKTNIFLA